MTKMKLFHSLLLIVFFSISTKAQNLHIIGKAIDEMGSPVAMGNLIALNPIDSSLITGTYFIDGKLDLNVKNNSVLLRITALGKEDVYLNVQSKNEQIKIGVITMKTNNTLKTFELVEELPLFEQKDGNTIINVEKTMLASSINVSELLSKSPSVIVAEDGVRVVGKGEAIFYLDGKRITFDRLKSIPINQIKAVEVITNPDAKFDAEGMAIVQIILKENNLEGHEFSVMQNFTKAHDFLSYTALGYNFQKQKFSLSADYSLNIGETWMQNIANFKTSTVDNNYYSENDYEEHTALNNVSNYRLGTAYQLNPNASVSFEYSGEYADYGIDVRSLNTYDFEQGADLSILAHNNATTVRKTDAFSFNLDTKLDSLGSYLFLGGQGSFFIRDYDDTIEESENKEASKVRSTFSKGENTTDIVAGQLDVVKFIEHLKLELGVKYSQVNSISKINLSTTDLVSNNRSNFENHFDYLENIGAAYFQLNGAYDNLNYMAGLRMENTAVKGRSIVMDSTVLDSNYTNFFPTVKIDFPIKAFQLTTSLSSRIERPGYQSLDPFRFYMNNNISVYGNPRLTPSKTHSLESKLSYKGFALTVGYAIVEDPMRFNVSYSNDGSASMMQENLDQAIRKYVSLTVPFDYKFWNTYNTVSVENEVLESDDIRFNVKRSIEPKLYWYSYNQFKVKKWFNVELSGDYQTDWSDGIMDFQNEWHVNLGISKFMLDNKLMIRIMVNDLFHSSITRGDYTIDGTRGRFENKRDTRFFRFYVKYSFGKLKAKKYKNVSVNKTESNRVK